jgi:hypothetical protein
MGIYRVVYLLVSGEAPDEEIRGIATQHLNDF